MWWNEPNAYHVDAHRRRLAELATQRRQVAQATATRPRQARLHRLILARLGRWLAGWGLRLQAKYGPPQTEAASLRDCLEGVSGAASMPTAHKA